MANPDMAPTSPHILDSSRRTVSSLRRQHIPPLDHLNVRHIFSKLIAFFLESKFSPLGYSFVE
jgi:hypothetical protein